MEKNSKWKGTLILESDDPVEENARTAGITEGTTSRLPTINDISLVKFSASGITVVCREQVSSSEGDGQWTAQN